VLNLTQGNIVTTRRTDIMYVVTEYGVVNLKGKSAPERAKALIGIADPDFREDRERLPPDPVRLHVLVEALVCGADRPELGAQRRRPSGAPSSMLAKSPHRLLCDPSQKGAFFEDLQPQR
jgi:hypothetical protein